MSLNVSCVESNNFLAIQGKGSLVVVNKVSSC